MRTAGRLLRRLNDGLAHKLGVRVVRSERDSAEYRQYQFSVPISKCVNSYGYSYCPDALEHPFVVTLKEYAHNPDITCPETNLYRFWQNFRPRSLQEALFGDSTQQDCKTASIRYVEGFDSFQVNPMPMPWSNDAKLRRYRELQPRNPQTPEVHFKRLTRLFDSVTANGYRPERYSDGSLRHGFIRVCMLKNGDDLRFVILGGQHRLAVLSALGHNHVDAIFDYHMLHTPPVVDLATLDHWTVIRRGLYDSAAAHRVFGRLFGLVTPFSRAASLQDKKGSVL